MEEKVDKLHLHARRIIFKHPFTQKIINVCAPLPPHMAEAWEALGLKTNYKEKITPTVIENLKKPVPKNPPPLPVPVKKSYGKVDNVRRSIWKPKVITDPKKRPKAQPKKKKRPPRHTKRIYELRKAAKDKEKKPTAKKAEEEKHYRSKRRVRPVMKLAPKIRTKR